MAVGAARGLCFLHEAKSQVIYRDFKASNILLDAVCYVKEENVLILDVVCVVLFSISFLKLIVLGDAGVQC